jgi:hypothetical protein
MTRITRITRGIRVTRVARLGSLLLLGLLLAGRAHGEDLRVDRRCAWTRGDGPWIEAGRCQLEGWRDERELLLTVIWPDGRRNVIETRPSGGEARIDRRPARFRPAADGSWLFSLQEGGQLLFAVP